jgi:hypothetical protein
VGEELKEDGKEREREGETRTSEAEFLWVLGVAEPARVEAVGVEDAGWKKKRLAVVFCKSVFSPPCSRFHFCSHALSFHPSIT